MSPQLATNIRSRRQSAGLSQLALAERTGLSQTWISRLEQGGANPTFETLSRIADALEINVSELLIEERA